MNDSVMYSGSTSQKIKMYTIYWLGYILLFSLIQGLPEADFWRALSNECYSVLPKILFVLLIVEVAMPLLFFKKKRALFILTYLFSILFFAFIQRLIDNYIIIAFNLTEWKIEPLFSAPVYLYNVIKLQFVITIPLAIKLVYYLAEEKNRVQTILSEKLEAELFSLRNQFHPHFLFNVLNSLYSKILSKSDDSADIVLQISDFLRYSVYDVNSKYIPLEKEIEYLKNYISLQQLRFDNRLELSFSTNGICKNQFIEPFLILPFIENSFKYCLNDANSQAWITISITASEEWLTIKIENSLPADFSKNRNIENSYSGVGITNVKRRLELLYPNQHSLIIKNEEDSFFVSLKIKINDTH
ncbi:sensor histidine kinase [Flavobacterium taihuense]|uniref:Histidine kinase n=1 Tax=Flavobacterium taihuense TaxID=2857508 RepID=A0ABS6XXG9_9FLAO|nr:histidine kinase [Flavobacterium taihuense]MBW4361356.1 histidine kinase [Flavobacterium taihuense]